MTQPASTLPGDWYPGALPPDMELGAHVFIDTSYCLASFLSQQVPSLVMGEASGIYDRSALIVGRKGRVLVGAYTCLNGTTLICNRRITIGNHCLLAWGVVITDTWLEPETSLAARRDALHRSALDPDRPLPSPALPREVVLEDNVWVGFESVILPGVSLGRGCVVACKTVIKEDIPPYTLVAGDPARLIRTLDPDDDDRTRQRLLRECVRDLQTPPGKPHPGRA